jgi:hypothetical protein
MCKTAASKVVLLGVGSDAREDAPWRHGSSPEASRVSNAADHAGRPPWLAFRANADRARRVPELGESLAGAAAGGHELAAADLDCLRD